ncbi:MAG: hypothetical protein JWR51_1816 [Devosia sp.]|uniref:hypothetical protein n=1 Tax=Devosia sp. TaxID=1871048 RepID=UPI00261BABB6|nr:hypothetical protein [Devosia sp.]MDB5528713.1 hypothetical protein [Devosia sp.]
MSWTELWGITGDMAAVERELGLTPARYRATYTNEVVVLPDPHYPSQRQSFRIQLLTDEASGKVWKFALDEITNGVYALIYQPFGNPN